ncbi:MAG TPA: hypothetical protein VHE83_01805 [Mycobacteriales bacterium]|nr:hypothetical protein [Mycobacteriales bacterium]
MDPNELPPLSTDVVVPDDARELAREVEAYRREQRSVRRRRRFGWLLRTRRGLPGIAVVAAIVLVIAAGTALALLGPTYGHHTTPRRLAPLASPTVAVGEVGGLLPDVALAPGGAGQKDGLASVRDVRPAVIVVLPAACPCSSVLAATLRTAQSHGVRVYVVATSGGQQLRDLAAPDASVTPGVALVDSLGTLAGTYPTQGDAPTAVVVDETGVVRAIAPALTSADPVRSALDLVVTVSG